MMRKQYILNSIQTDSVGTDASDSTETDSVSRRSKTSVQCDCPPIDRTYPQLRKLGMRMGNSRRYSTRGSWLDNRFHLDSTRGSRHHNIPFWMGNSYIRTGNSRHHSTGLQMRNMHRFVCNRHFHVDNRCRHHCNIQPVGLDRHRGLDSGSTSSVTCRKLHPNQLGRRNMRLCLSPRQHSI